MPQDSGPAQVGDQFERATPDNGLANGRLSKERIRGLYQEGPEAMFMALQGHGPNSVIEARGDFTDLLRSDVNGADTRMEHVRTQIDAAYVQEEPQEVPELEAASRAFRVADLVRDQRGRAIDRERQQQRHDDTDTPRERMSRELRAARRQVLDAGFEEIEAFSDQTSRMESGTISQSTEFEGPYAEQLESVVVSHDYLAEDYGDRPDVHFDRLKAAVQTEERRLLGIENPRVTRDQLDRIEEIVEANTNGEVTNYDQAFEEIRTAFLEEDVFRRYPTGHPNYMQNNLLENIIERGDEGVLRQMLFGDVPAPNSALNITLEDTVNEAGPLISGEIDAVSRYYDNNYNIDFRTNEAAQQAFAHDLYHDMRALYPEPTWSQANIIAVTEQILEKGRIYVDINQSLIDTRPVVMSVPEAVNLEAIDDVVSNAAHGIVHEGIRLEVESYAAAYAGARAAGGNAPLPAQEVYLGNVQGYAQEYTPAFNGMGAMLDNLNNQVPGADAATELTFDDLMAMPLDEYLRSLPEIYRQMPGGEGQEGLDDMALDGARDWLDQMNRLQQLPGDQRGHPQDISHPSQNGANGQGGMQGWEI